MNPITQALEELRKNGWQQGGRGRPNGPKCIVGAIQWVQVGSMDIVYRPYSAPEVIFLTAILREMFPSTLSGLDYWNDTAATWPEVEALMEKAALRWDEEHAWD